MATGRIRGRFIRGGPRHGMAEQRSLRRFLLRPSIRHRLPRHGSHQVQEMMHMDSPAVSAREFVRSIELPAPPPATARARSGTRDQIAFESDKDQALVVGSDLVSFVGALPAEQRGDIVNALLLAQLRARKVVPQPGNIKDLHRWYDEYLGVLSQIGFAVHQATLKNYDSKTDGFEAHQAVLEVVATLVAGAPGALAVVSSTLTALQKMDADNPWITLFNSESRSANTAHFQ